MMGSGSSAHNSYAPKTFFLVALLCLLAYLQVDDKFTPLKKVFSLQQSGKTEVSLSLARAEPLQIQIAYRVTGNEPIEAALTLTINDQKAKELAIKETASKKIKFAVPLLLFKEGENRIAWQLKTSRPGFILEEIKFANHTGINPNVPIAWVVPDELANQSLPINDSTSRSASVIFQISLAIVLYIIFCRIFLHDSLHNCLLSCHKFLLITVLLLCATALYSSLTPQKIIFPTETVFWLIGFGILATQFPALLAQGNSTPAKKTALTFIIICLISILSYLSFFKNAWYVQDDYLSIHWGQTDPNKPIESTNVQAVPRGTIDSIMETSKSITGLLYKGQGRYQPIRLFIFMIFMHFFQEEHSPYYNFALHLANIALLFLILRKFKLDPVIILISLLMFSLYSRWRMMESPSAMIAGSGLNLFLISLTLLFLIKALENNTRPTRKTMFFCASWFAYYCLVFSYEVAFPLILPLVYVFYIFNQNYKVEQNPQLQPSWLDKNYFYLAPYFALLIIYILFFNLTTKGTYPGTTLSWSFADIWARFTNYMSYTLSLRINLNHIGAAEITVFFLYLAIAIPAAKATRTTNTTQQSTHLKTLLFGLLLYLSSMVLFILNSWESPKNIMVHHVYLMTAGASILLVTLLFQAERFLPEYLTIKYSQPRKILRINSFREHYRRALIFVLFPLVLVSESNYVSRYYTANNLGATFIKPIKVGIQKYVDPDKTDAIIIKNFHHNYYGMSSVEGAFMHWLHLNKVISSGRPILSASNSQIQLMRPLSNYRIVPNMKYDATNERTQILFLENNALLPYQGSIDFEKRINLHQTIQVWGDQEPDEFRLHRLDAILKNTRHEKSIEIKANSEAELETIITHITRIEVNGEKIKQVSTAGNSLFIDIRPSTDTANYLFLTLASSDKHLKKQLQLIRLSDPQNNTALRDIASIGSGEDSWAIW